MSSLHQLRSFFLVKTQDVAPSFTMQPSAASDDDDDDDDDSGGHDDHDQVARGFILC